MKDTGIFKDWNILKWVFNIFIVGATIFLLTSMLNIIFAVGYILMLFVHELGHIMAAKGYDISVRFGGFTPFGAYMQVLDHTTTKQNAVIAISGPISGLIMALLYYFIFYFSMDTTFLRLCFFTGFVSLMNLLPLDPFDGGKIAESICCYLPMLFLPLLSYIAYQSREEITFGIVSAIALYILMNVRQMRKRHRLDALLDFEKTPKLLILFIYMMIVLVLAGLLFALYLDFQTMIIPELKPIDFQQWNFSNLW